MKKLILINIFLLASFFLSAQVSQSIPTSIDKNSQIAMSNEDYKVTPGDVYALTFLAGNSPISLQIMVDSSYKIRVANLGVLDVSNTTFVSLKKQVESIVTRNYPMSGVQFALAQPGTFSVTVKGEVATTVETSAWALTRLSSVVDGCKNQYASIRNVKIESSSGKEKTYDLFKAKRFGDMSQDPYLRPGDVITLSSIEKSVSVSGAVKRPGTYELLEGEGLKDLINYYCDGFAPMADSGRIELYRTYNTASKTGEKQIISQDDIDNNFVLLPYDSIKVFSYNDLKPIVFLRGAIYGGASGTTNPGNTTIISVPFNSGENYTYLIRNNKSLFGANADLEKAYILRGEEFIPINLYDILYNNVTSDILVEPNDTLTVPAKQLLVSVLGAVKVPGRYPYMPGKDWNYYINLAGGFIDQMNSFESVKIVDANGKKMSKDDDITPETVITAKSNDFLYYFNTWAPVITTVLGIVMTSITLYTTINSLK